MPRVMGKVRRSEDANSAWIALPLMDPLDGKLLFIHPTLRSRVATQEAIFSFWGEESLSFFICLGALFTHTPLEILCRKKSRFLPYWCPYPCCLAQGQSCEQRLCMFNSICEWPFLNSNSVLLSLHKIWPDHYPQIQ